MQFFYSFIATPILLKTLKDAYYICILIDIVSIIMNPYSKAIKPFVLENFDFSKDYLIDLSYLGLLKVTGPDAKRLLQGELTCNVEDISLEQPAFAAHCNAGGRIISLFNLFLLNDAYYLSMPRDLIPLALKGLKKYALFYKVNLYDCSEEWMSVGLKGTLPKEWIPKDSFILKWDNRFQVVGPNETITALSIELNKTRDCIAHQYWIYSHIQAGIPTIYADTSEKFLPHDINLPALNAISFTKGCYTGQEIIARMHYRGKLKNHLEYSTIHQDTVPIRNSEILLMNNKIGILVDYCETGYNTYHILSINRSRP